jgi:hypothetical protein
LHSHRGQEVSFDAFLLVAFLPNDSIESTLQMAHDVAVGHTK